jgi:N-acetylglucosamine-6-phosphate deacetylase
MGVAVRDRIGRTRSRTQRGSARLCGAGRTPRSRSGIKEEEVRLGVREAVVEGRIVPGDVIVEDGLITRTGASPAGRSGLAAPGFVDLQVNGFAGVDFLRAGPDDYSSAGQAMAATGVTAYQPTFISSPTEVYETALKAVAEAGERPGGPRLLGVHLEGPFLSPKWPGAHDPAHLVDPDAALAERLCGLGPVTYMTLAPELAGALDLIGKLAARGIVVACGHTDADATMAHAAYDAGARAVTHLYNGQRRWRPRDPGIAGVSLVRSDVVVQAIVDLVHLAAETVYAAFLTARSRFAVVTDAIMAAALPDGSYRLDNRRVTVSAGEARLDDGTLAGGVSTMDAAVRNLASLGLRVEDAIGCASSVPARLVGRNDLSTLREATPADVVVLNSDLFVRRTLVDGSEVFSA